MKKTYQCFSLKLAGYLMQKGFIAFDIRKDSKSRRFIYLFNDSEELQSAVLEYKK